MLTTQEVTIFWKTFGDILGFLAFGGCITLLGILIKILDNLHFKSLDWKKVWRIGAVHFISVLLLIFLLSVGAISYTLLRIRLLGSADERYVYPPKSIVIPRHVITATSVPPSAPGQIVGTYDFEQGTEGWGIAEGKAKSTRVNVTSQVMHSGMPSLEATSPLLGDKSTAFMSKYKGNSAYLQTHVTVWFNRVKPIGSLVFGPYDLAGQEIGCWILVPRALATGDVYIQIFIKDERYANQYAPAVNINKRNVGTWIQLTMLVGDSTNNSDPKFSPKEVDALGIQLATLPGSKIDYAGPFYISGCIV